MTNAMGNCSLEAKYQSLIKNANEILNLKMKLSELRLVSCGAKHINIYLKILQIDKPIISEKLTCL